MSEITVSVVGSSAINPTVGNGDTVNVSIAATGERGVKGDTGATGPSNSLAIGTVSQGTAAATITGTAPSQVLNLVLPKGDAGTPATNVELQATSTHVQWRYVGASSWTNLVALSAITGPQGSTGAAGTAVELQATSTHLQWRYVGGSTWTNVFALSSLVGATGPQGPAGPAGPPINLGDETPQPLGTASAGTALTASRADHRHAVPVIAYGSLTGTPATFAPSAHTHAVGDVVGLQTALEAKASLVNGTVPSSQLPSYVDDVREAASVSAFPATGDAGVIYVAVDTKKIWRWSGSTYVEISPSPGTTTDVPEGNNLYFTDARAVAAIPTASSTVAGVVKVGTGLSITDGVLSATGGGGGSFAGTVDGGDYVGTIIGGGGGATTDPLFSSVRLLINADGAAYAYDSSSNGWTVSSIGNAAATTTNPKFGTRSLAFDGSGDYLRIVTGSSSFAFGTGDFTAEAWIWFPSLPVSSNQYFSLFDTRSGSASAYGYAVFVNASGQLGANWGDTQNGATLLGGSLDSATWHHVALVRSAGTMRLYANGICVANTATNVGVNLSHNEVWISRSFTDGGGYYETSGLMGYWNGYIDDIRLTAAARYTGTSSTGTNFTVPIAAFPTS